MSVTAAFTLQPNEWTAIGPLANVHMLQVKERKSIRLHFGDVRVIPAADSEAYVVTQDYNPRPLILDDNFSYYEQACLFAMPDDDEPVKVVCVLLADANQTSLFPASGSLKAATVDVSYRAEILVPFPQSGDVTAFTFNSGTLPAGLQWNAIGANSIVSGVPTELGTFFFTVNATLGNGDVVSGTYSITVEA